MRREWRHSKIEWTEMDTGQRHGAGNVRDLYMPVLPADFSGYPCGAVCREHPPLTSKLCFIADISSRVVSLPLPPMYS